MFCPISQWGSDSLNISVSPLKTCSRVLQFKKSRFREGIGINIWKYMSLADIISSVFDCYVNCIYDKQKRLMLKLTFSVVRYSQLFLHYCGSNQASVWLSFPYMNHIGVSNYCVWLLSSSQLRSNHYKHIVLASVYIQDPLQAILIIKSDCFFFYMENKLSQYRLYISWKVKVQTCVGTYAIHSTSSAGPKKLFHVSIYCTGPSVGHSNGQ